MVSNIHCAMEIEITMPLSLVIKRKSIFNSLKVRFLKLLLLTYRAFHMFWFGFLALKTRKATQNIWQTLYLSGQSCRFWIHSSQLNFILVLWHFWSHFYTVSEKLISLHWFWCKGQLTKGAVHLRRRQALGWRGMISLVNLRRSLLLNIGRKGSKSEKNRRRLKWKAQKHYRKVFCV